MFKLTVRNVGPSSNVRWSEQLQKCQECGTSRSRLDVSYLKPQPVNYIMLLSMILLNSVINVKI